METSLSDKRKVGSLRPRLGALPVAALGMLISLFSICSTIAQDSPTSQSPSSSGVLDSQQWDEMLQQSYEEDLAKCSVHHDWRCEAEVRTKFGMHYDGLGQREKALECYGQALSILPAQLEKSDGTMKAAILDHIGMDYYELGQPENALDYLDQALKALPAEQEVSDRVLEGIVRSHIGGVYASQGRLQKALSYLNQALMIERDLRARGPIGVFDQKAQEIEEGILNQIASVYDVLGSEEMALKYLADALDICLATHHQATESMLRSNTGAAYLALGQEEKTLEYLNWALRTARDGRSEGLALTLLGAFYLSHHLNQKALENLDSALKALPREEDALGKRLRIFALMLTGASYTNLEEERKALEYYQQALGLVIEPDDPFLQGYVFSVLMVQWRSSENPDIAIFFGKQAVNAFQKIKTNILSLDKELQRSFAISGGKSEIYRSLADLLITQGRLAEAREVLDLLKEQEYREVTRGQDSPATSISSTAQERAGKNQLNDMAATARHGAELSHKSSRSPEENLQLDELRKKENSDLAAFFDGLYVSLGSKLEANDIVEKAKEEADDLQSRVKAEGVGTVAIYTLVAPTRYVAIVITPREPMKAREYQISYKDLRTKIFALTEDLRNHHSNPLPRSQELYNILVAPIEKDLKAANAQTLVWSLNDALRYVPLAALHDGNQYLVERYRNVVIAPSSPYLDSRPDTKHLSGLAMGISKKYEAALPELMQVPAELKAVVYDAELEGSKGVLAGTIRLDNQFTEKALVQQLNRKPSYSVIHLASHFVFNAGDYTESYLLLAGKETGGSTGYHLTMEQLRDDERFSFSGAELLTLSACETAAGGFGGDGREVDTLGRLLRRKGAKAVLASLWEVKDETTGQFMADFYRRWITTTGMTKVGALQQAQLDLLHASRSATAANSAPARDYSHPYYWAPFVLMGNWR